MKVRSKAAQLILQKQNKQNDNSHIKNIKKHLQSQQNSQIKIQEDHSLQLQKQSISINGNSVKNANNISISNLNNNNDGTKINNKNSKNKIHKVNLDQYLVLDLNLTTNQAQNLIIKPQLRQIQVQKKNIKSPQDQSFSQKEKNFSNSNSELEMQNYRLIQVNYQMIQRNVQLFQTMKNKLLQALNFIEDFSYAEGVKVIYKLLNYLKGIQKLNKSSLVQNKYQKEKQKIKQNSQNSEKNLIKKQQLLKKISQTIKFDFVPQPKLSFYIFNKPTALEEEFRINIQNNQRPFIKENGEYLINQQKINENRKSTSRNKNYQQNLNMTSYSHNKNRSFNQGVRPFQSEKIIDKRRTQQRGYQKNMNIQDRDTFRERNYNSRQWQKESERQRSRFNINLFKTEFKTESVQSIVDTYSERQSQIMEYSRLGDNFREREVKSRKSHEQHQIVFHKTSRSANQQAYRMMLVQANVIQSLHSKIFK